LKDFSEVTIKVSDSIEDAINILNSSGLRIVLVIDKKGKLLGTVTDGDIRRALLKRHSMNCEVKKAMNDSPITALGSETSALIISKMKSKDLLHIPIIDENGFLIGLETLQHLIYDKKYDNPVFLMAGGFGTRLYPLTETTPKPLLNVGGQPILQTILERFIKAGFHKFYISTHFKAEKIHEYFGDGSEWDITIKYINEETPLGTAGAIGLLPANLPNLPILMMNGDILTMVNFERLLAFHEKQKGIATMCVREYEVQIPFGVVNIKKNQVKSMLEKPIQKFFVNAGVYVLDPDLVGEVESNKPIDMPHLFEQQIKKGKSINVFPVYEYWMDIGHKDQFERANKDIDKIF
jgi:dTDP-glucose pyrophosphorylase